MGFFKRGKSAAKGDPLPSHAARVLGSGVGTIARHEAVRQVRDPVAQERLVAELGRWATAGWVLQHDTIVDRDGSASSGAVDEDALFQRTKAIFDGSQFPGLAPGLGSLQRSAVCAVLPSFGLAAYDPDQDCLCLHPADGSTAIVSSLGALDQVLSSDEPARKLFTATLDSVMWGVAAAIAEGALYGGTSGGSAPVHEPTFVRAPVANVSHLLSFEDSDGLFDAQQVIFDRVPSVSEVTITNPEGAAVQALFKLSATTQPPPDLGQHLMLVVGPPSASASLTELAMAHGGSYCFQGGG